MPLLAALCLLGTCLAAPRGVAAGAFEPREWFAVPAPPPELASPLTLQATTITGDDPRPRKDKPERTRVTSTDTATNGLNAERARTLLRSLTVPGWGQVSAGHPRAGLSFALAEAGVWAAFTAFRVQETLRAETFRRTARLDAGIELDRRDEEFLRIVGSFISSDEYNQLVVTRDAANLYLIDPDNPDLASYRAYIAEHSLSGRDAWSWNDIDDLLRYRAQRRDSQRAGKRANTALALAVANRILSALHAARISSSESPHGTSWRLEVTPGAADPTSWRAGLRADF